MPCFILSVRHFSYRPGRKITRPPVDLECLLAQCQNHWSWSTGPVVIWNPDEVIQKCTKSSEHNEGELTSDSLTPDFFHSKKGFCLDLLVYNGYIDDYIYWLYLGITYLSTTPLPFFSSAASSLTWE